METPRGRVSMYTNIDGATGGFPGNAESAESAGFFDILAKSLGVSEIS